MFGRAWRLGSIGGIPIRMDPSTLILVGLLTYSLWNRFGTRADPGRSLLFAAIAAVAFIATILLHELAHAVVARLRGIRVRGVTLLAWGGFTETEGGWRRPGDELLVAVAGPATSIAVGYVALAVGGSEAADGRAAELVLRYVGGVNVFLGLFNLLPGFPLDGGRVFRAILWKLLGSEERASTVVSAIGQAAGVALVGYGLYGLYVGSPWALWPVFLGMMMFSSAGQLRRSSRMRAALAAGTARDVMRPPPATIPAGIPLSEAHDRFFSANEHRLFPVEEDGRIVGVISFDIARPVGREDPLRPVRDAMVAMEHVATVAPEDPLDRVDERIGSGTAALVLRGGELVGEVRRADLLRWVQDRVPRTR